ncbi:MAG: hypothetical protein JXA94_01575 [Parachlamydiales bacterium]|nr:hypothetical protein [Parachlamydiales bacterium]
MKVIGNIFLLIFLGLSTFLHANTPFFFNEFKKPNSITVNQEELNLIYHVKNSIIDANLSKSKLNNRILKIEGMSSPKGRHLLNNICRLENTYYLEVGTWKGSTFVSSLYQNENFVKDAIAVDDWSQFSGPKNSFLSNCKQYLKKNNYRFYETDCFLLDLNVFKNPINIYFFDGNHSQESQEHAFLYFNPILDNLFIAIVDDWNWEDVRMGTFKAFDGLNYKILYEEYLPSKKNCESSTWWNGTYVVIIKKS